MNIESSEDNLFASHVTRRSYLQSTGSSSSTSLEVSEILEGAKKPGEDGNFDENIEEDIQETDEQSPETSQLGARNSELVKDGNSKSGGGYDANIWPQPPDVAEVGIEAQRLAAEAIERAAVLHMTQR